jgi:hypothetical protein
LFDFLGDFVFQCYYKNKEQTLAAFVTIDNERFFKTGDLAYYNSKGELVVCGRSDFQLKVRGQRVDGHEIEHTIMSCALAGIAECLIVQFGDDESLIAYISQKDKDVIPDIDAIRKHCQDNLRSFCVPSHFLIIDKIPVNSNGKLNRSLLPMPWKDEKPCFADEDMVTTELEMKVAKIWRTVLSLDFMPAKSSSFISLGGSSVKLMGLVNHYQEHLKKFKNLSITYLLTKPTLIEHVNLIFTSTLENRFTNLIPRHMMKGQ